MITFNQIPKDLLVPGGYIEFDPSLAGTSSEQTTVLILGQKTALGEATLNEIYPVGGEADAIELFDQGSMLHTMASLFMKYNFGVKLHAAAVNVDGTFAKWPILCDNASAAKTIGLAIGGYAVNISISADNTAAEIATKLMADINSYALPVTASVDGDTLNITAKHPGIVANDITISLSDTSADVLSVGTFVPGTGTPNLDELIETMADDSYDYIINPYLDDDNVRKLRIECDRRWHAMIAKETHVFMCAKHDYSAALDFTDNKNSSHLTFMPIGDTPQAAYIWTTMLVAIASQLLSNDPAAPLGDKKLPELIPGKAFTTREMNDLLHNGASTFRIIAGEVYISYLVTTYQVNAQGSEDSAYRDIQVPEILKNIRRIQIFEAMKMYSGYKVAKDASKYKAGQRVLDPDELKGFLYQLYRETFMREFGWVQDDQGYLDELITEISATNNDHVLFQDQPRLIGQFRVLAGRTQFIDK